MLNKIRNKILPKNPDNAGKKRNARIDFDNSFPDVPRLDGKRMGAGSIPDMEVYLDNCLENLLKEHNTPRAQKYLTEIRPYMTYEDEPVLNGEMSVAKMHLDKYFPKISEEDFQLEIQLIHEINKMGCHVLFIYRIDSLEDDEIKKITPLLMGYVGRFESVLSNLELILKIGRKGNYQATDFLIEEFKKPNIYGREITDDMTELQKELRWSSSRRWAVSNALLQIKDKSRLDDYIEFTKNTDTRQDCFLITDLIGRYKCQKSYECLIDLLNDTDWHLQGSALNALRFYYKYDDIEEHVRPFLDNEHDALREYARKNMRKIQKYRHKKEE